MKYNFKKNLEISTSIFIKYLLTICLLSNIIQLIETFPKPIFNNAVCVWCSIFLLGCFSNYKTKLVSIILIIFSLSNVKLFNNVRQN